MKYRLLVILSLLLLLLPYSADAQRRKKAAPKAKVEEPAEDPRITQMLASTQQIVFIDSMVVSRDDFMSHIPLSVHLGKLSQSMGLGTFTNEMGDHRLSTVKTSDSTSVITSSDFIANRWTDALTVGGIGDGASCNPFLMPDGITLYFAQKSDKSIGGYDLFVTRYDSERGIFLRPENMGMPFTSEADDLFYAVDEFSQLGYFVTDRRQPAGKVCIYVFIPQDSRHTYPTEAYSDQQIRSLAAILSIADTWGSGHDREEALARLEQARLSVGNAKNTTAAAKGSELDNMRHQEEVLAKALTLARNTYANASEGERQKLRQQILVSERQLEQLQTDIRQKEKQTPYNN